MRMENTKIKFFLIKFISWCIQNSEHSRFLSRHIIYLDRALFHKIAKLHKFQKVIFWCKCLIFSRSLIPDPPTLCTFSRQDTSLSVSTPGCTRTDALSKFTIQGLKVFTHSNTRLVILWDLWISDSSYFVQLVNIVIPRKKQ